MHVTAFVPAIRATVTEDDAVAASGLPMARCLIPTAPAHVTIPIVLSVWTERGADRDVELFVIARDADGIRRSVWRCAWQWPDVDDEPYKHRVFAPQVEIHVERPGTFHVGLFSSADGTVTDHWFPLPIAITEQPQDETRNV